MNNIKGFLTSVIMAFIAIPLLAHGVTLVLLALSLLVGTLFDNLSITPAISGSTIGIICALILGGSTMCAAGRLWAEYTRSERNNAARHCLLLFPALLVLAVWVSVMHYSGYSFTDDVYANLLIWDLPWWGIHLIALFTGWYWGMVIIPAGSQICFTLGYFWQSRYAAASVGWKRCRGVIVALLVILSLIALWQAKLRMDKFPQVDQSNSVMEEIDIQEYQPDVAGNKLTKLHGEPELRIVKNWPRLDGATAAYPLYASAFHGLNRLSDDVDYWRYLSKSRTPDAYKNIINGEADIIFVAEPSEGQKKRAAEANVKLIYTPFAREAFVFIVNANNPVSSLSEQQVRDIFSGKITNWRDVGGSDKAIQVWQRPVDSGSQTVMLAKVMQHTPMLPAKETEVAAHMGGIIREVADYQNTQRAIGYTFRYYATQMNRDKGIKLLAVNGIAPTAENIRNGTYPWSTDVYMVTRKDSTPETQKIVDWFVSPQGQRLVQDVGYVPLYKVQE